MQEEISDDGLSLRHLRRAWLFRAVRHLHVHVAGGQLVKHLVEAPPPGFVVFGADNPADVVVLLIGGALRVGVRQATFGQCAPNIVRHHVPPSFQAAEIRHPRLSGECVGLQLPG